MGDPLGSIYIDKQISRYKGYLPDDWTGSVLDKSKPARVLHQIVVDLVWAWRATAYTASMPVTAIKAMQAATLGYAKSKSPDASIVAFSDAILDKVSQKVPELVEDRRLRAQLMKELVTVADEFRAQRAADTPEMPIELIWQDFLNLDVFSLSVWSSQRISFVAFYNAYEAFLVNCAKQALGVTQLRATDKPFLDALRTAFGSDLSQPCWTCDEIKIGREVRHSLSHAGGRETKTLKKQKHDIILVGDVLQIVPDDNHRLLRQLRVGVDEIVTAAAVRPKFA
ncbi:MAG: hypothetical protein ABFD90_01195 [Phycisphaerales bacterium]